MHVLVDGNAGLGSGFLDGAFLNPEGEFGLPEFALLGVVQEQIPGSALVAVDGMDDFASSSVLCHLLQVIAFAATRQVVVQVIALDVDGDAVAGFGMRLT